MKLRRTSKLSQGARHTTRILLAGAWLLGILGTSSLAQTAAQRVALASLGRAHPQKAQANDVEATSAPLLTPYGLAFDSAGNLYIADAGDNLVREINVTGVISTVAGSGSEGYSGDGGAATSAELDTPTGVAVDASGNLYIADTLNNCIRKVSGGAITTIAGTGVAGFSGDGGPAATAELDLPAAVAVDSNDNVYIADTNNNRIREIVGTTINTVAGNGQQTYSGDSGPATAAALNSPTGVAVDSAFNIYIGDTENQRVRMIASATGIITTMAGTGVQGFTGDGPALSTELASPSGVYVDASGTVYVADSDNDRICTISAGKVTTIAGDGVQGFSGDGSTSKGAWLDTPRAVTSLGNAVLFSDTLNNRVREVTGGNIDTVAGLPAPATESLVIGGALSAIYGTGSLTATFSNGGVTGTGLVTFYDGEGATRALIGQVSLSGNAAAISTGALAAGTHFIVASFAGDGKNAPITSGVYVLGVTPAPLTALANAASMLYGQAVPTLGGALTGVLAQDAGNVTAVFTTTATNTSAPGRYPISIALSGSAAGNYTITPGTGSGSLTISPAPTITTLNASTLSPVLGASVMLTANVASTTSGTPTGAVNFLNGTTQLNSSPVTLSGGSAVLTVTSLPVGALSLTAVYSGSTDFTASTSSPLTANGVSPDFSIAASPATQSVVPFQSVNYTISLTPANSTFAYPVTFSASGLPNGVIATFSRASIATGAGPSTTTLTLSANGLARLGHHKELFAGWTSSTALALLLLPVVFGKRTRMAALRLSRAGWMLIALLVVAAAGTIIGCGGGGYFGHSTQSYTVTVTAVSGPDTHTADVTLTVE